MITDRGCFGERLSNGNILLNKTIWFCNGCTRLKGRSTNVNYYAVNALKLMLTPFLITIHIFDVLLL